METNDVVGQLKNRLLGRGRDDDDDRRQDEQRSGNGPEDAFNDLDSLQALAQTALLELEDFLISAVHPQGLNQEIWLERWSDDAGDLASILDQIEALSDECLSAMEGEKKSTFNDQADAAFFRKLIRRCGDFHQTMMVMLENAQRLYREMLNRRKEGNDSKANVNSSSSNENSAYLASPLMSLDARYADQEKAWGAAQKAAALDKKSVFVEKDITNRIGTLFAEYTKTWDSASADGFKGANFTKFRRMTEILEEIVSLLVSSDNIYTHASIGPGSAFFDLLMRLLKQSCGSREVMSLAQWWKSVAKLPPK